MGRYILPADIRFWQKVRFGEGMDDCWEWTGFLYPSGHGQFHLDTEKYDTKAHRAAWILYNGPIRGDQYVCHKCHNPKCVRLDHLYLGSHVSNQADERGRRRHEKANYKKLNWVSARYIRSAKGYASRVTLANLFNVSITTISRIWQGVDKGGWREEVLLNG